VTITTRRVAANGFDFAVDEAGQGDRLALCLHGFPESRFSWRYQLPFLAELGYRAWAPDLRGYGETEPKPRAVSAYLIDRLMEDVAALIDASGAKSVTLIGHDWGAGLAWTFAANQVRPLERLVIMNVPHPARMLRALRTARQLRKSWYMFFFQLPRLPEALLRANDFATLRRLFRTDPVRRGAFSEADIERYVEAARQPGALTAGINYYRALFRQGFGRARASIRPIEAPVLVIWGEQDRYLGAELAEPDLALVPHARVERLPDASHWVHVDRPERVNALLLDFLADLRRRAREDTAHHSGGG
jgi:epoxide hydrolase 4